MSIKVEEILPAVMSFIRLVLFCAFFYGVISLFSIILPMLGLDRLSSAGPFGKIGLALFNTLACVISLALVFLVFPKRKLRLGLKSSVSAAFRDLALGFVIGGLFLSAMIGLLFLTGGYQFVRWAESPDVMPYLLLFLIGAFNEELFFRGYLFQDFEETLGIKGALLLSSFIFGFAHMINYIPGVSAQLQAIFCTFLSLEAGLPLAMAFILTRSIWLAVGMHWAWNFFEGAVYGANVSGHELNSSLILARLTDGVTGGGGAFGPEFTLVNLGSGLILFFVLNRVYMQLRRNADPKA